MATIQVVRIYEDPGRSGSERRILVDRLWPRGVRRDAVDMDEWAKEVAPSSELRKWYGHTPERFAEFARRYREELAREPAATAVDELRRASKHTPLVLLTATRAVERSGAEVLREALVDAPR